MGDDRPRPNGFPWPRPGLPPWITVASVAIALVAVSGLLYLLYTRTEGPGEVLRTFAGRVDEGSCAASYDLLADESKGHTTMDEWCDRLPAIDSALDADFDVRRVVLHSEMGIAEVHIAQGGREGVWNLRRSGRTWRVLIEPEDA